MGRRQTDVEPLEGRRDPTPLLAYVFIGGRTLFPRTTIHFRHAASVPEYLSHLALAPSYASYKRS